VGHANDRSGKETQEEMSDQPWIETWPMWDEPLSKVEAAPDIVMARWRLA